MTREQPVRTWMRGLAHDGLHPLIHLPFAKQSLRRSVLSATVRYDPQADRRQCQLLGNPILRSNASPQRTPLISGWLRDSSSGSA